MPSVQCPRCAKRLTVSDWAPPMLTCPDCLARVPNPQGVQSSAPHPSAMPRRVIPIEQQIERDSRAAGFALWAMAALLAGGALVTFQVPGLRNLAVGMGGVAALVVVTAVLQMSFPESDEVQQLSATVGLAAGGCLKVALILFGVLLLLIGTCAVMIMGSGWRG